MKESKKQIQTRLDKIEFLNGLKNKSRKLEEIIELPDIYLEYVSVDGTVVIKNNDGNLISREEGRKIRNRSGQNVMIVVKKDPAGLAYQAFNEDRGTNPKIGNHISFIPAVYSNSIIHEDE